MVFILKSIPTARTNKQLITVTNKKGNKMQQKYKIRKQLEAFHLHSMNISYSEVESTRAILSLDQDQSKPA